MRDRSSKRPKDANQLAKLVVDIASGDASASLTAPEAEKNAAAVALGRLGGLAGGKARAKSLTGEQRSQIARKAAKARWKE